MFGVRGGKKTIHWRFLNKGGENKKIDSGGRTFGALRRCLITVEKGSEKKMRMINGKENERRETLIGGKERKEVIFSI